MGETERVRARWREWGATKLLKPGSSSARQRRWVIGILLCLVLYTLAGFLLLPWIIKLQLRKQLPIALKRNATVEQVRLNPWALTLTVRGITVTEPNGDPFASLEEFYANLQLSSLFRKGWVFKDVRLVAPKAILIRRQNGELNIANLFEKTASESGTTNKSELTRVFVDTLTVTNGFLRVEDRALQEPFRTEYQPINLVLRDLTTAPGEDSGYRFHAANESGMLVDWKGQVTVQPPSSTGSIEVRKFSPANYQPYVGEFTRARIAASALDVQSEYAFALGTNGMELALTNGSLELTQFKVTDPATAETVLSVPEFFVNGLQFDLARRAGGAQLLRIAGLEGVGRLNEDGTLNIQHLIPTKTNAAPATNNSAPWSMDLSEFQLTNATVVLEDRTRKSPFRTRLSPIDVSARNLTTRSNQAGTYSVSITTEGAEKIESEGTVSLAPIASAGQLKVQDLVLKKYWPYLEPFVNGQIASGQVDFGVGFAFAVTSPEPAAAASNAVLRITGLEVKGPANGETVISVPEMTLEGGRGNSQKHSVTVDRIRTVNGSILARRETNGTINLTELVRSQSTTNALSAAPEGSSTNAPWAVAVGELAVENYSVALEDRTLPNPALVKLDQIGLNVKGYESANPQALDTRLGARINASGAFAAEGKVKLIPMAADLQVLVTNLDLRIAQPYLQPFARVEFTNGIFNLSTRAQWEGASGNSTNAGHLRLDGGLSITNLAVVGLASDHPLVAWTNLAVHGFQFETPSQRLHVDSVFWNGLQANVLINSNRQINLTAVLSQSPTNAPAEAVAQSAPKKELPPVTINLIALTNAAIQFTDASVQPPVEVGINPLGGTITGLSSQTNATAHLDLQGIIGEQAPFWVSGAVNPLAYKMGLDLAISNRNMQLTPFSPYAEKFVGHPINKGRLSTELRIDIKGQQLQAEDHLQIDQLTLGPRIENSEATKLPVKLAVALLKDSSGQIALNIPLSGRLDDPKFQIGPVVGQVIGNLITKAVASPFKLIGAAVGGGEELSYLQFVSGTAQFIDGETNKVAKLVRALENRGLSLDIHSSVDLQADGAALAHQIVEQEIKQARLEELAAAGQKPPSPDTFQVMPFEKARLLRAAVAARFGTNLSSAISEMVAARSNRVVSATEERPPVKWYKKLLIPFQVKNSPEALARAQAKADAQLLEQNPALARLSLDTLEDLLASKVEVPPETYVQLLQERDAAARRLFLEAGLPEDRIFVVPPKAPGEGYRGQARAELSLS